MKPPFENRYCPNCLCQVDEETGDHWEPCEYESSYGDWVNPKQPLTEIEMMQRLLRIRQDQADHAQSELEKVARRLSELQSTERAS